MASKKQQRFIQRAKNKANSGVPASDEEFEEQLMTEELKDDARKKRF